MHAMGPMRATGLHVMKALLYRLAPTLAMETLLAAGSIRLAKEQRRYVDPILASPWVPNHVTDTMGATILHIPKALPYRLGANLVTEDKPAIRLVILKAFPYRLVAILVLVGRRARTQGIIGAFPYQLAPSLAKETGRVCRLLLIHAVPYQFQLAPARVLETRRALRLARMMPLQ